VRVCDQRDDRTKKRCAFVLIESSRGGAARGLGEGELWDVTSTYPASATPGGVTVFLMGGKWSSAGKSRATTKAYTAGLASSSRRGTRTLGKLWQLGELAAVSCYTGQRFVRGSEGGTLQYLSVAAMRNRLATGTTVCLQGWHQLKESENRRTRLSPSI